MPTRAERRGERENVFDLEYFSTWRLESKKAKWEKSAKHIHIIYIRTEQTLPIIWLYLNSTNLIGQQFNQIALIK